MRIKRAIGAAVVAAAATGATLVAGAGVADAAPAAGSSQACVNNIGVGIHINNGVLVVQPHQCSHLFPAGYYRIDYANGGYEYRNFPAGRVVPLR